MITVKYGDYEETFPYPTPLQLLVAVRIGVRRMYERNDGFELPKTYNVYVDGQWMDPKYPDRVINDGSTIELKYADPSENIGVTLFELDL